MSFAPDRFAAGSLEPAPVAGTAGSGDAYQPGVCNIGPWEIRRRRMTALFTFGLAAVAFVALVATGAPHIVRLLLLVPLWGGMFSWLQARRRFCGGFAVAGVVNFGPGELTRRRVTDDAAHRADLRAVRRMLSDSFLLALPVTLIAVLFPR